MTAQPTTHPDLYSERFASKQAMDAERPVPRAEPTPAAGRSSLADLQREWQQARRDVVQKTPPTPRPQPAPAVPEPPALEPHTASEPIRHWHDAAACASHPGVTDHHRGPIAEAALGLCAACPVVAECLAWAQSERDFEGVAGGRTFTPRKTRTKETAA